jgi:hypothetical protein
MNHMVLRKYLLLATVTSLVLGATGSYAQVLLPISGVTATANNSGSAEGSPSYTVSNNTLQAGPSAVLGASDSLGDSGFQVGTAADFGNWVTGNPGGFITYNLGATYNISDLLIWNFSQEGGDGNGPFNSAGANSVTILSSTTGAPLSFTTVGTYTFNEVTQSVHYNTGPGNASPGTFNIPSQVLSVSMLNTQYVELVINSNHGWTGGLTGLAEVNFVSAPEPSTYAMLIAGLAVLVFALRRKGSPRVWAMAVSAYDR